MSSDPAADQSQSSAEPKHEPYWHLRCRPWDYTVPLLEVLALHFDKNYDEVAEIIANDCPLVGVLLADWSSKFRTQRALVDSALTEWSQSYLRLKWNEKTPEIKGKHVVRSGPKEKYPEQAARSFCFMPFTELAFGYDYDYLKKDYSPQYAIELVAAIKQDFGITIKYTQLPLFGAAIWPYEVEYWPIEMIHVSIAVPLMLNLM